MARGEVRPLTRRQRRAVERAVHEAEETTGLQLCVYVGPGEEDTRAQAEALFLQAGLHTRPAVLVLVEPVRHRVEVVTAPEIRGRIDDPTCELAVATMARQFARGDLAGGIVAAVDLVAAAAGPGAPAAGGEELPDVLGPGFGSEGGERSP
ncbi:MAG TPA: DUF5130 family protein [Acidimicrobiales bacterium]|nr:DUF5130 family protein [Acidimicrobiales bacterium]